MSGFKVLYKYNKHFNIFYQNMAVMEKCYIRIRDISMELKLSQSNCCKIQIKCSKYEVKKISCWFIFYSQQAALQLHWIQCTQNLRTEQLL